MMTDPFGTNTVLCLPSAGPKVTQQTLTLTFNSGGVLTNIDNKPALTSQRPGKAKALDERFMADSRSAAGYFAALCPLATQLFRVCDQRTIDFHPVAVVNFVMQLYRTTVDTQLVFARSMSSRSASRPLAIIACSTVAPRPGDPLQILLFRRRVGDFNTNISRHCKPLWRAK